MEGHPFSSVSEASEDPDVFYDKENYGYESVDVCWTGTTTDITPKEGRPFIREDGMLIAPKFDEGVFDNQPDMFQYTYGKRYTAELIKDVVRVINTPKWICTAYDKCGFANGDPLKCVKIAKDEPFCYCCHISYSCEYRRMTDDEEKEYYGIEHVQKDA